MGDYSPGRTGVTCLKKAAREMDRSSKTVLDDAKMPRRTAGVTGILLDGWPGGGLLGLSAPKVEGVTVFVEDRDKLEWDGMMVVVGSVICRRSEGRGGQPCEPLNTHRTRTGHDAGDSLVPTLVCPPAYIRCPSFPSLNSTTSAQAHTLA